nr:hypothetical protein [Tanacetum cinerariifolium]
MAKQLSAASAHEYLFVDFLSKEEPKKVSKALKHPRWVDSMQDELNQFSRNKVWTLIHAPYVKTPMVPPNNLGPHLSGKYVNETQYRGMIGSLMYLTASIPVIQFSTCLCARYQANPKESHLIAIKRIFRKSTSGACQLLGGKLVCWSAKKQQYVAMSSAEAKYVAAAGCCANILWIKSQLTDYDIIYEKEALIHKLNNKTRENIVPYSRFLSLLLEHMMPEYENEELTINLTQAQQAAGGPTSLGATDEEGAHPQLSSGHDASADSITEADPRISAPKDSIS